MADNPTDGELKEASTPAVDLTEWLLLCSLLIVPLGIGTYAGYYFDPVEGYPADYAIYLNAASLARGGQGSEMYDLDVQQSMLKQVTDSRFSEFIVWNHHPFEALLYLPATLLPYETGLEVAHALNAAGIWALCVWIVLSLNYSEKALLLLFVALMATIPFQASAISMGQDSVWLLAVTLAGLHYTARNREAPAGVLLGIATIKFTVVVPLLAVLLVMGRRRIVGIAIGAFVAMAALSSAALGFSIMPRYVALLIDLIGVDGELGLYSNQLWNFRGLVIPYVGGAGLAFVLAALGGVMFAIAMRKAPRAYAPGLALLGAAFFSPHLYRHDGLFYLGAIALLLIARFSGEKNGGAGTA